MTPRLPIYFRTHRLNCGLTQAELSFLVAGKTEAYISRIERGERKPTLEATLAYAFMFETTPQDLIVEFSCELEAGLLARAEQLYCDLQGKPCKRTNVKLDSLEMILSHDDRTRL